MLSALLVAVLLQEPRSDWSEATAQEVISLVQRERDEVDLAVFAELGRRATDEALAALRRCSALLGGEEGLNAVFAGVGQLATASRGTALSQAAQDFLLQGTLGESWAHRRPATRALAALGGQAEARLRRVMVEAPDPRCKQIACGALVPALERQGDAEALELLLTWYRSPTSGPTHRLRRVLSGLSGEWVLPAFSDAVRDRARPAVVRAALVGALAVRGEPEAGELVIDALRERDLSVQLAAVNATTALGDIGQRPLLGKLLRSRDAAVRRAAFVALDQLRAGEAEWEEEVEQAARGRDVALRLGSVAAYARRPGMGALDVLLDLARDESHLVRRAALRALGPRRDERSLPLLIDTLETDTLRQQAAAREVLFELTGLDHGTSAARWRAWWEAEGATYVLPEAHPDGSADRRGAPDVAPGRTQAEFYGIPLGSDRVCFVVDTSGSMDRLVYSGGTRLEAATGELLEALESYPVGGHFNLVFFASRARRWRPSLSEMDAARLAAARKYVRGQRPKGGTALHDGLLEALEDEDVDTIVVLSDGEPTVGELTDPVSILADIRHRNRLREIVIHCIALNHHSDLLEGLAGESGGSYREVR